MIRPVYIYGTQVLRKVTEEIKPDYPGLAQLISDMYETMSQSDGVGLAAPQIGLSIRLFVIDASPLQEDHPELKDFKRTFINPKIVKCSEETILYNEGCLSIPSVREDIERPESVVIQYYDENFIPHEEEFHGFAARIVQHEYDHLEGILFTDRMATIKRHLLKNKLSAISKGKFNASYRYKLV